MDPDSTLPPNCGIKRSRAPEITITGPPMTAEESAAWIAEVMAPAPPSIRTKFAAAIKVLAGLVFLGVFYALLAWGGLKLLSSVPASLLRICGIDVRPVELTSDPARQEQIRTAWAQSWSDDRSRERYWRDLAETNAGVDKALKHFYTLHRDLRNKHHLDSRLGYLLRDHDLELLLESRHDHDNLQETGQWDAYVQDCARLMRDTVPRLQE